MRWCSIALAAALVVPTLAPPAQAGPPQPWCAPELETLPGDVCFHGHEDAVGAKRSLVIFLHGLVQQGAGWQHNQMRAAVRGGKRLGFSVVAPRGRLGANRRGKDMVAWPTSRKAQEQHEADVLAEWRAAIASVEKRNGAAFDEVFVVGFSNGAYYGSSLALRGAFEANGYAVFAGGSGFGAPVQDKLRRAPIFVGIAGKDSTAKDSRALARTLQKHGWPHRAETRKVGHTMADAHLDHAIAYLRKQLTPAR
jgi:predicted esterase